MPTNLHAAAEGAVPAAPSLIGRCQGALRRAWRSLVLRAHAFAEGQDWLPNEWGQEVPPIPEGDADAILAEWLRQLRLWAAYSPEEAFAWKIGGLALAAVVIGLVVVVGAMR